MRSPRFQLREQAIRAIFSGSQLRQTWRNKVRVGLRDSPILDPIEHLDFHVNLSANCSRLEQIVCTGNYIPGAPRRILVEKSKGLCRQVVIPLVEDALILQTLSDALYRDIKDKAPSKRAFFEPEDHRFSNVDRDLIGAPRYGSYRAWLTFQQEILRFAELRNFVVITDIANYFDFISYRHLRNIIASHIDVRESVLDMLIFVLSGLLWQPDYMPRVEIGLPQINLDAPRILAHCFLYDLDEYMERSFKGDFVRFMDDIDIGVDTVNEAKEVLKNIDLILHTRQVRLNSGKTQILSHQQAADHFRIRENHLLNSLGRRINLKTKAGLPLDRERRHLQAYLKKYYRRRAFDTGNGEKILKRIVGISGRIGAVLDNKILADILTRRPNSRSPVFAFIGKQVVAPRFFQMIASFIFGGSIVDDVPYVESASSLVDGIARTRSNAARITRMISTRIRDRGFYAVYASLWLMSKYSSVNEILSYLRSTFSEWQSDRWLGRLVGGLNPIFRGTTKEQDFRSLIIGSQNSAALTVFNFHQALATDTRRVGSIGKIVMAVNTSKTLGITHSKFLLLLSILSNSKLPDAEKKRYVLAHKAAWGDYYYRRRARSLKLSSALRALI